jgi:hypothetical protein
MKADSKSKALWDGAKCVELAPTWSKGYNRLGTAQHALGRFDDAIDTFKKGECRNICYLNSVYVEGADVCMMIYICRRQVSNLTPTTKPCGLLLPR